MPDALIEKQAPRLPDFPLKMNWKHRQVRGYCYSFEKMLGA